jgi:ligand-binding sensor domain-containing protein
MKYLIVFIFLFSSINFSQIDYQEFLSGAQVVDLTVEQGALWVATNGKGIHQYIFNENKWITYSTENKNIENNFFECIAVSDEYVWAGTTDGLFILDRKRNQWKKRKFAVGGEYGNWIRSLAYDPDQNVLWIGRFKNLTRLDVAKQKFDDYDLTMNSDPKSNTIKTIRFEDDAFVWFGTEAGAFRYDKSTQFNGVSSLTYFSNKKNAFRNEGESVSVTGIIFDKQNIWFGTDEFITDERPKFNLGGIYRFNRRATWDRIDKNNGLVANGIFALARTGNKIWVSVYQFDKKTKTEVGKGIYLIDRVTGKITKVNPDAITIGSNTIKRMLFDGHSMWLATDAGLWRVTVVNEFAVWNGLKTPKVNEIKGRISE